MPVNLAGLVRPTSVTIFKGDPVTANKALAYVLSNTVIPLPGQVRMHTVPSLTASSSYTATRSPVEAMTSDNLVPEPEALTVQCTLSANPLGSGITSNILAQLGTLGSVVRIDLKELRKIRALAATRELLLVVTPPRVYKNMALTNITEVHEGMNKVNLTLTFQAVQIVSPIYIPDVFDALALGPLDVANAGVQSPTVLLT